MTNKIAQESSPKKVVPSAIDSTEFPLKPFQSSKIDEILSKYRDLKANNYQIDLDLPKHQEEYSSPLKDANESL